MGKAMGKTSRQVASEIGIAEPTASTWLKEPEVQAMIREFQVDNWTAVQNSLLLVQGKALKTIVALLDSSDDRIRLQAAKELLTMASSFPEYMA